MLLLDRQRADLPGEVSRSLALRVGPDGHLVDLPRGKTTIGSSPRCNVRIQQPGVQPLHCLILHEAQGLSVRRWAGDTLLNGRQLVESSLAPGDRLSVGSVELEIVGPHCATELEEPVAVPAAPSDGGAPLRAGRDVARQRSRQLLAALRRDRTAHDELKQRIADLEHQVKSSKTERESVASELHKARVDIVEARRQLTEQNATVVARQGLTAENQQLRRELSDVAQRIEQLTREQAASAVACQVLTEEKTSAADEAQRVLDENSRLREHNAQLTNQNAAVCSERDEQRRRYEQLRSDLNELAKEKAALGEEFTQRCGELRRENDQLQADVQEVTGKEAALADQVQRLIEENAQLREQGADLSHQVSALRCEGDNLRGKNEQLQADVQEVTGKETALADQVQRLVEENTELREQGVDLSHHVSVLRCEGDELREKNERLQTDVQEVTGKEAALADEVRRLAEENSQLREQGADLSHQVSALRCEGDELRGKNERLQTDVQVMTGKEAALADQVRRLVEQTKQLREQGAERTNQISALRGQCDEFRRDNERLHADVQVRAGRETMLADEVRRLVEQTSQLQVQGSELSNEISMLRANGDELRRENELLQAEVQVLAKEKAALAEERPVLCGERDGFRQQYERIQKAMQALAEEKAALAEAQTAVCGERDELRRRNEQLNSNLRVLTEEKAALADDSTAVCGERDELRQRIEQLYSEMQVLADEKAKLAGEQSALIGERDRLRLETDRLAELERQVLDAVADRENTSSELYRALLQLAEMQERDEHHEALAAAHQALNEELANSADEVAQLQGKIERLTEERTTANGAQLALAQETSELRAAQQSLTEENAALANSLGELRQQLEAALRRQGDAEERLQAADALQQQLEKALQDQAASAETVAQLKRDLATKQKGETESAASIAERERQLADRERRLAESSESVRRLEQRLAATEELNRALEQAHEESQRVQFDASHQEAEQSRRIAELEEELAAVRASVAAAADAAVAHAMAAWRNAAPIVTDGPGAKTSQPVASPDEHARDLAQARVESPRAEFDWSSVRAEPREVDAAKVDRAADILDAPPIPESGFGDSAWGRMSRDEGFSPAEDDDQESGFVADGWGQSATSESVAADAAAVSPWNGADPIDAEPATTADRVQHEAGPDVVHGAAPSMPEEPCVADPPSPRQESQSTSFIERYSHLFAEEDRANDQGPAPPGEQRPVQALPSQNPRAGNITSSETPATAAADEESVEQYMAKLLQRVRGETQGAASAHTPRMSDTTNTGPLGYTPKATVPTMTSGARTSSALLDALSADNRGIDAAGNLEPGKRKASAPAPATDLEALRALANETARRAISRHALRKHRRSALTKVIVSTLAGVTSLWLMLESPDWKTLQFITACVSMLVAAYWGGETFRTLLESLRVAADDESDEELSEFTAQLLAPLPIDIPSKGPSIKLESRLTTPEPDAPQVPVV